MQTTTDKYIEVEVDVKNLPTLSLQLSAAGSAKPQSNSYEKRAAHMEKQIQTGVHDSKQSNDVALVELTEAQLAFVGGGIGETAV